LLQHPEIFHVFVACSCADADKISLSKGYFFCLASFLTKRKNTFRYIADDFCDEKNFKL
jgi:hypothetical protein